MKSSSQLTRPNGERISCSENLLPASTSVDTFGGKIHIEWDAEAPVTPMGQ